MNTLTEGILREDQRRRPGRNRNGAVVARVERIALPSDASSASVKYGHPYGPRRPSRRLRKWFMPVLDLYSRRKRRAAKAGQPDVYQYDDIPRELRVQIIHIWNDAIGPCLPPDPYDMRGYDEPPNSEDWWHEIHEALAREKGMFSLARGGNALERCTNYLLGASNIDDVLDAIDVTFRTIYTIAQMQAEIPPYEWREQVRRRGIKQEPMEAISELNFRLTEAGVGYLFEQAQLVRVDSQYLHTEAVKPALALLSDSRFQGPHQEFLHAHELYRTANRADHKTLEDAVAAALKAFESTLKVICALNRWPCPANATAAPLIQTVIDNCLVPVYLKSSLEGLATLSNRTSRHGQGAQVRTMPPHFAAYALHLAAANIVMLVEAFKGRSPNA